MNLWCHISGGIAVSLSIVLATTTTSSVDYLHSSTFWDTNIYSYLRWSSISQFYRWISRWTTLQPLGPVVRCSMCAPVLLSHRSKMIGTGTSPSSSCRHYLCLLGSFSVVLVCGALTFSHLERGPEVQIRFELSERKQEFAKKFKVNGDSLTFYSYCKASK